jgi:hypothetical protein
VKSILDATATPVVVHRPIVITTKRANARNTPEYTPSPPLRCALF